MVRAAPRAESIVPHRPRPRTARRNKSRSQHRSPPGEHPPRRQPRQPSFPPPHVQRQLHPRPPPYPPPTRIPRPPPYPPPSRPRVWRPLWRSLEPPPRPVAWRPLRVDTQLTEPMDLLHTVDALTPSQPAQSAAQPPAAADPVDAPPPLADDHEDAAPHWDVLLARWQGLRPHRATSSDTESEDTVVASSGSNDD